MNTSLRQTLLAELADIERQQEDRTLPHSDQQLLDQAWEDTMERLEEIDELEANASADWRDARAVIEEEDRRPPTPVPAEPVRLAPPKSVTLQTGINKKTGKLMTLMPDGRWVAAPPLPWNVPPIQIPKGMGAPTTAPPPPRPAGARVCNCDCDGECEWCEEERIADEREELERWNNMVDDREGCAQCSGCHYCTDDRYDGADEV